LNEGPLGVVEKDGNSGLKLDLGTHPAGLSLSAHVEAVEGVAVGDVEHLELSVDVLTKLGLPRVGAVAHGLIEAALAVLRDVLQRVEVVATGIARVGD
jgi:hypothetical protein